VVAKPPGTDLLVPSPIHMKRLYDLATASTKIFKPLPGGDHNSSVLEEGKGARFTAFVVVVMKLTRNSRIFRLHCGLLYQGHWRVCLTNLVLITVGEEIKQGYPVSRGSVPLVHNNKSVSPCSYVNTGWDNQHHKRKLVYFIFSVLTV